MTEEASYKCVIGSQTFETDTDKTLLDYNIQFEDNHPAECWVEIEDEYAKLVEANQLLVFHIVPWQGTTLGQFFYGMVYDKWVSGPNQMRILAKCALEQGEHLEVDMIFAHTIHDNEEFDIDEGATSNDPPRANLGVPYTDVVKPITRVQCALYPENYKRPEAPLMTTGTTISLGNGRKFIATRFVPETDRYIFLGFYGTSDANYDVGIYEESEYGFPDFSKLVYEQPNKFPRPAGGYHGVELLFHPTEFLLSVGIPYWIIVSPNNLINPYDFTFYSDPFINSKGITGLGVAINSDGQNSGWAWSGPTKDEIGIMSITPILWKTVREHLDWELINDSGTGVIEFGGIEKFIPDWVTSFTANRMGCRVFFFEDQLDAWWIYATLGLNIMGSYVNAPAGVLYVPFVDAMESKVNDILRGVSDAHGWHFRQYHRDEGVNWYEKPPVLRAEPLPSFGSPVLDLKHGDDATDVTTQARIVSDSLKKQVTRAFTGVDMMGNDAQGNLLYWRKMNWTLENDLDTLNYQGRYRKYRSLKLRNVVGIDEMDDLADSIIGVEGYIVWRGPLTVDGATWIVPGQTIKYQNSRRGIAETEFRTTAVTYTPHGMTLHVTSLPDDMAYIFRRIEYDTGKYGTLQPLRFSDLNHTFHVYGEIEDDVITPALGLLKLRLLDANNNPVSHWRTPEVLFGPPINGKTSKLIYCNFPPEGGDEGSGYAKKVYVQEDMIPPGNAVYVSLDHPVGHWEENTVVVCILMYRS